MVVVATPGTLNLVFMDRKDLETVTGHLQAYLEHADDEPDNTVRVYSIASEYFPQEQLSEVAVFLKERFSHNEG